MNNSQKISLARSQQQTQKSNILGLDSDPVSLLPALSRTFCQKLLRSCKIVSDIEFFLL